VKTSLKVVLEGCTEAQRRAITHPGGPLLVLAGAGSGKTRVITRRIAYLLHRGVRPVDLLAITFTNKAADEMRERVVALCGTASLERGLWVSTFHSMCARMLRHHAERLGYTARFSIYDAGDTLRLVRRILKDLEIPAESARPPQVAAAVSHLKNRLVPPDDVPGAPGGPFQEAVRRVYPRYREALRRNNAMDFDDLLLNVVRLLEDVPDVGARYARRFRHILVDEYQDTNHAQYRIARALAAHHRNLCVTGDPDQSIYGWRGADITNILDFERDYPDATIVVLDKNYRSTGTILHAANHVIVHNRERKHKDLHTDNPAGGPVRLCVAEDDTAEAHAVAGDIARRVAGGASYDDFAVFYRTNAQSRALESALREADIPHRIVAGVSFFDRMEVKDLVAYLRAAANPADAVALDRILNVPPRGLGERSRQRLRAFAAERGRPLADVLRSAREAGLAPRQARATGELADLLARLREKAGASVADRIKTLLALTGYRDHLRSAFADWEDREANCEELVNLAAQYDARTDAPTLDGFLERVALASDQDTLDLARGAVKLMTLHTAKGLEFPVVYVTGLEEELLPLSGEEREIEEERRLFFVGLTRAQREVVLTRALTRRRYGQVRYTEPSRFLEEIPRDILALEEAAEGAPSEPGRSANADENRHDDRDRHGVRLREGDPVYHPTFGGGVLLRLSGSGERRRALVRFARVGEKHLVLKYAPLEKRVRRR